MNDDEIIREMAGELLTEVGYEVAVSRDGEEALQNIMKIDPAVKAVVSSGYSNAPVMADFARYGFTAVLPKPYGADDIRKLLRKILGEQEQT